MVLRKSDAMLRSTWNLMHVYCVANSTNPENETMLAVIVFFLSYYSWKNRMLQSRRLGQSYLSGRVSARLFPAYLGTVPCFSLGCSALCSMVGSVHCYLSVQDLTKFQCCL